MKCGAKAKLYKKLDEEIYRQLKIALENSDCLGKEMAEKVFRELSEMDFVLDTIYDVMEGGENENSK